MSGKTLLRLATTVLRPEPLYADAEDPVREAEADRAKLDSLRGDLVRALDRMAAGDAGSSASFRRI